MSIDPAAVTLTRPTFCHTSDPPVSTGPDGAVWSSRTIACVQEDSRPTPSTAANRTSVSPSALTPSELPAAGADQVEPPSVEVWYS